MNGRVTNQYVAPGDEQLHDSEENMLRDHASRFCCLLCLSLLACAAPAKLAHRELARIKNPLVTRGTQFRVRVQLDGEYIRLIATEHRVCKTTETVTVEDYDPRTRESVRIRQQTTLSEQSEVCEEHSAPQHQLGLQLGNLEHLLGTANSAGVVRLSMVGLLPFGADVPDRPEALLPILVDGQRAGALPLAPLLARRSSRADLLRQIDERLAQPELTPNDFAVALRTIAELRARGLDGADLAERDRRLFQKRELSPPEAVEENVHLEEARVALKPHPQGRTRPALQVPPQVVTSVERGPPSSASAAWAMKLVLEHMTDGARNALAGHGSMLCSKGLGATTVMLDLASDLDLRMKIAWAILKSLLGDEVHEYCRDLCVNAMAGAMAQLDAEGRR